MTRSLCLISAFVWVAAAGCAPDAVQPFSIDGAGPAFAKAASPGLCPRSPDVVVVDEAGLRTAVATAPAGATIAITGMIDISGGAIVIDRSDLRLTCAAAGAGLRGNTANLPGRLIRVHAPRVAVTGLQLDGRNVGIETVLVQSVGATIAEDVTLADNDIVCGPNTCAFFVGTPRAVIVRNRLTAAASVSGIHVQRFVDGANVVSTDGTRIEQNVVTTTGPSTNPLFGGIRVRDGSGVAVVDNVVTGPWMNSMSLSALFGGEVARNELSGAAQVGMALGLNAAAPTNVDGLAVRNNRITGAGVAGIDVLFTCRTVFVGNNPRGNTDDVGAVFFPETGANTLVGNGTIVFDNGTQDCDGDGIGDPNIITGATPRHGLPRGAVIGSAVSAAVSAMQ